MKFLDLIRLEKKIGLAQGVSLFKSVEGMLLVKHNNKLFTISTKSDSDGRSRLFRILQQPRTLNEILKMLSEFKKNDIIAILETLYEFDLISFEIPINSGSTKNVFNVKDYRAKDRKEIIKEITILGKG